jgi:hypothetical protein
LSPAAPQAPPLPALPAPPPPPPMFGQDAEAGMRTKKKAAADSSAFGTMLGSGASPTAGQKGSKTLLGQ